MRGGRVLIVDDEPMVLQSLSHFLRNEGYTVDCAQDGNAALARIHEQRPDALLLDIMMPGLNGRQLLKTLRDDPRYAELPVVVMTAVAGLSSPNAVLSSAEMIEKPFVLDELLNKVALAVYRSGSAHRRSSQLVPAPTGSDGSVLLVVTLDQDAQRVLDEQFSERGIATVVLRKISPQLPRLARALNPRAILIDQEVSVSDRAILASMEADPQLKVIPVQVVAAADGAPSLIAHARQLLETVADS
jgi:DNA-binding response OmpR family regulator